MFELLRRAADVIEQHGIEVTTVHYFGECYSMPRRISFGCKRLPDGVTTRRLEMALYWSACEGVDFFAIVPRSDYRETFDRFDWPVQDSAKARELAAAY